MVDVVRRLGQPVRDVRARVVRQTSCPGAFADVTVDFEPPPEGADDDAVAFVDQAAGDAARAAGQTDHIVAFREGVLAGLAGHDGGTPLVSLQVVLRELRSHPVDSTSSDFREAGWVAARHALRAAGLDPDDP